MTNTHHAILGIVIASIIVTLLVMAFTPPEAWLPILIISPIPPIP